MKILIVRTALIATSAMLISACSLVQPVQPWEKGNLAKPEMVFDEDALDSAYVEHTYSSKEAAFGGAGVGGGGCGCN
jgi:hypothetical protein